MVDFGQVTPLSTKSSPILFPPFATLKMSLLNLCIKTSASHSSNWQKSNSIVLPPHPEVGNMGAWGFCKTPLPVEALIFVDNGLGQNNCLHSGLLQQSQSV